MSKSEVFREIPVEVAKRIEAIAESCDVVMRWNSEVLDASDPWYWLKLRDGQSEEGQMAELTNLMTVYTQPVIEPLFVRTFAQRFEGLVVSKIIESARQDAASGHRDLNAEAQFRVWTDHVLWPWEHSQEVLLAVGDVTKEDNQIPAYIHIQKPASGTSE